MSSSLLQLVVVAMKPGFDIPHVDEVAHETWDLPSPLGWDAAVIRPLRDHIDDRVAEPLPVIAEIV